jgi:hypothetical protein
MKLYKRIANKLKKLQKNRRWEFCILHSNFNFTLRYRLHQFQSWDYRSLADMLILSATY